MRTHEELPALLTHSHTAFAEGPVDYTSIATGPDTERQVVASGLHLLKFDGHPVAVMQRAARPEFGQQHARLEILAEHPAIASASARCAS